MRVKFGGFVTLYRLIINLLMSYLGCRRTLVILVFLSSIKVFSQVDTTYIKPFDFHYAARAYVSKSALTLIFDKEADAEMEFAPNNPASFGLGFAWKNSSLNLGYGFSSLRDKKKGKTKILDLQYHHYAENWLLDLYVLKNKGFYMEEDKEITLYSDLKVSMFGGFSQYVFSGDKFSFGAAFDQNKKQIRSAGSWLIGGHAFYTSIKGVPLIDEKTLDADRWNLQLGPNGGYAYSWVFAPNFYFAATMSLGVNVGFEQEDGADKRKFAVNPLMFWRGSLGYNGSDWTVNFSMLSNKVYVNFSDVDQANVGSGQFKFTFVKRFDLKKEISFLKKDLPLPNFKAKS